jgi:hypothetical protein
VRCIVAGCRRVDAALVRGDLIVTNAEPDGAVFVMRLRTTTIDLHHAGAVQSQWIGGEPTMRPRWIQMPGWLYQHQS